MTARQHEDPRAWFGGFELQGRTEELQELDRALERALAYATPQTVAVLGASGVGRTRLLNDWCEQVARSDRARVFHATGRRGDPSYGVFARLLEQRFELASGSGDVADKLRRELQRLWGDKRQTELVHFVGSFLGKDLGENPFLKTLDGYPVQHEEVARAVLRALLEKDAEASPLVLVVDDLHLADDASVGMVRLLAETLAGSSIVLVWSYQPDAFAAESEFCRLQAEHTRLTLSPLTVEQSLALIRQRLARFDPLPDALIRRILELTGGNPAFIEQMIEALLADGIIDGSSDPPLVNQERIASFQLPVSLEQTAELRIGTLTPSERDVAEKAAILGQRFWSSALVSLTRFQQAQEDPGGLWAADVLERTIAENLDGLTRKGFVERRDNPEIAGEQEYGFLHELDQRRLLAGVRADRGQRYHLFAAQWLEARINDRGEAQLERLAHHYLAAGQARRAAYSFVFAGDRARSRYAYRRATNFYADGIPLLGGEDVLAKIDALDHWGDVCDLLGHPEQAAAHFGEMLQCSWLLDDKSKGAQAHLRLGRIRATLGDYENGEAQLRTALRLFRTARNESGVAATLDELGQLCWIRGEYRRSLEYHREALTLNREHGDRLATARSLNSLGRVYKTMNSFPAARDCFAEAWELRRAAGDQPGMVDSLTNLGGLARARCEYQEAFDHWMRGLNLARQIGVRLREAHLLMSIGEALTQMGKLKVAEGHLIDACDLARDVGAPRVRADCHRTLSEVYLAKGAIDQAEEQANLALEIVVELGLKPQMGLALRTMSAIWQARGTDAECRRRAESLRQQAIDVFTELGYDLELARTLTGAADYYERSGDPQRADGCRRQAEELFARLRAEGATEP
jgi:tetratricopeptide (TPR) repeat protein